MPYSLYHSRSVQLSWGASNYRSNLPRERLFSPQPGWDGLDYYRAHALNPDPMLYHHAQQGQYSMEGVTLDEAKPRHRQIYEASGDIHARYSPHNIGHAAAYETYRIWTHNPSIRGLGADYSQRCEVFIAIAIAEVSHIFRIGQVNRERRELQKASHTAAATASTIFQALGDDEYSDGNRISPSPPSRHISLPRDESPDDRTVSHESRSRSRRSSSASNSSPTTIPPNGSPQQSLASVPIQINNFNREPPYNPGGSPYSGSSSRHAITTHPEQYPGSVQGVPTVGNTYGPNWEFAYQTQTYVQIQSVVAQPYPVAAGPLIIILPPVQQPSYHTFGGRTRHC